MRRRTYGKFSTINHGSRPIGALVGDVLDTHLGVRPTLIIAAAGMAAATWLLLSPLRRLTARSDLTPGPACSPRRSAVSLKRVRPKRRVGQCRVSIDAYNLPTGILGHHPEDFYGALGRIVCVSAVLEDKITSLRHTLEQVEQGRFAHEPAGQQIPKARELAGAHLSPPDADRVRAFLDRAKDAFKRRNDFVHSSFPSQPAGRVFGHRPARSKKVTDGTADVIETSVDIMRLFIGDLATLVQEFNAIFALCGAIPPVSSGTTHERRV